MDSPPDGIIITISASMLKEKGLRNWLRNFLACMSSDGCYYYMRQGAEPKRPGLRFVYLCIGNKIRYRAYFAGSQGPSKVTFNDGKSMEARAWVILAGPVERSPEAIPMKGFRGFRYTKQIF